MMAIKWIHNYNRISSPDTFISFQKYVQTEYSSCPPDIASQAVLLNPKEVLLSWYDKSKQWIIVSTKSDRDTPLFRIRPNIVIGTLSLFDVLRNGAVFIEKKH